MKYQILAAVRVVSLVTFNLHHWVPLVPSFDKLTYLPIVPMANQYLICWTMVIYMELLWMFISIIFHMSDPCSLSYEMTIKRTYTLQYMRNIFKKNSNFHDWRLKWLFHSFNIKHIILSINHTDNGSETSHILTTLFVWMMVFNATFNNISVISWRSVLFVEETGVPGENHRPVASHWQTLSHDVVHLALIGIRTHNISVIGTDRTGSCKSNYYTITARDGS
jgi:hypothetical protein